MTPQKVSGLTHISNCENVVTLQANKKTKDDAVDGEDDGGGDDVGVLLVDGCDGHWDGDNVDVWQLFETGHAAPGEERTEEKQMNVRYKKIAFVL